MRVVVLAAVAPLERVAAVPVIHATAVGPLGTPIFAHVQAAQRLERTARARALRRPLPRRAVGGAAPAWRRLSERAPVHDRASDADDALMRVRAAWPGAIAQLARLLMNAAQAIRERRVNKGMSRLVYHEVLSGQQHAANQPTLAGPHGRTAAPRRRAARIRCASQVRSAARSLRCQPQEAGAVHCCTPELAL